MSVIPAKFRQFVQLSLIWVMSCANEIVGSLGIVLDISVAQLVVPRPSRSVVVSSNFIHVRIYMRSLLHCLVKIIEL